MILLGILPCEVIFGGAGQSYLGYFHSDDNLSQAAKDVDASQDALFENRHARANQKLLHEAQGIHLRCERHKVIVKIMAEVLRILAIATKEVN